MDQTPESPSGVRAQARDAVLSAFHWVDGHSDMWSVFADGRALSLIVGALVAPYRSAGLTAVAGIEARGFLLGGAAAQALNLGFVAIRKPGALFPGEKYRAVTEPDYRGRTSELTIRRDHVRPGNRLLLVDDWIETGHQALAAQHLIGRCGGHLAAVSVVVDQLTGAVRERLPPVSSLLTDSELPPDLVS